VPRVDEEWVCIRCTRREARRTQAANARQDEADALRVLFENQQQLINTMLASRDSQSINMKRATLRKLTPFTGDDITEWPTFHTVYNQTTEEGRYDAIENCGRLLDYLKPPALSMVKTKLANPANLPEVWRVYKDRIYDKLIEAALSARSPKDGRRESMFEFANKVSDLVSNLGIMEMEDHLKDARLINDFKKKLSVPQQERWIEFARNKDVTSLSVFLAFLKQRAQVLCEVILDEGRPANPPAH
jgi:hypothetical protein